MSESSESTIERAQVREIAQPLDDFYRLAGLPLPKLEEIAGADMPEPYRKLLVHQTDMTSTLERHHHDLIGIQVVSRKREGECYYREVLLVTQKRGKVVEFGAIRIHLDLFPQDAQAAILEERTPLGTILNQFRLPYGSKPKAYLKVWSDDLINRHLRLTAPQWLYGRRNTLLTPGNQALAEIVEILPP